MATIEIRNRDDARKFILQGLWLQQTVSPPVPWLIKDVLTWSMELANGGNSLPPIGFVADIGIEVFQLDRGENRSNIGGDDLPNHRENEKQRGDQSDTRYKPFDPVACEQIDKDQIRKEIESGEPDWFAFV